MLYKTIVIASEAWQSPTYRAALHRLGLPRFARNDALFLYKVSKPFLNNNYWKYTELG
jgi:hypothetical protein